VAIPGQRSADILRTRAHGVEVFPGGRKVEMLIWAIDSREDMLTLYLAFGDNHLQGRRQGAGLQRVQRGVGRASKNDR
jgi:hypothetical protein